MLALGLQKVRRAGEERRIALVRGDAMRLPVADASADAVTVGFGIRNVQKPEVGCAEMARVLRRGGRLAILEFGMPRVPGVRALYDGISAASCRSSVSGSRATAARIRTCPPRLAASRRRPSS